MSVLLVIAGCPSTPPNQHSGTDSPCLFTAQRIHIVGLTSLDSDPGKKGASIISIYISMHDSFDSSIKLPGILRFELYEYVPRSSQPRGKRILDWPEFDLTDAKANNKYWKDFLRAYKFTLKAKINSSRTVTYILQATCITPAGKRLTDIFYLNTKK